MTRAREVPAVFARGGTSKGLLFHARDLPESAADRDALLLKVLGSPDENQRQLNGMGGGLSSLSKAVIVSRSSRDGVDLDYTFAQVAVDQPIVDYGLMCGNMSACVGPFALREEIIDRGDGRATVMIHNTNTGKRLRASFDVCNGVAVEEGAFVIPGVSGSGAPIALDYLDPGGARTSRVLPTGRAVDQIELPATSSQKASTIDVSIVDATNPVAFVRACDLDADASALPNELEAHARLLDQLDTIRRAAAVASGMCEAPQDAELANPKIAIVGPSSDARTLDGRNVSAGDCDITMRMVSMGRVHRAVTLTGAMCAATAGRISGSLVHSELTAASDDGVLRIGTPSGVIPVSADVDQSDRGVWHVHRTRSYRTQRQLMRGVVFA
ncbi:MAG: PrpF domain-containing protein [Pseudomonadota bacterium]